MANENGNGVENQDLANLGTTIIKLNKLLIAVVFVSLAIISTSTVMGFRSSQSNGRILELVERCVVDGECGPTTENPDPQTVKVINYLVDSVACVLLVSPEERTQETIDNCKIEAARNE